jgi:hypothetical protein
MLPEEIRPALDNCANGAIATCALDGTPNGTIISQVWYVDRSHVALSFQFFNKTIRNVRENPFVQVAVMDYFNQTFWMLSLRYDHSETTGPIFDAMEMRLEVIASMQGLSDVFKLRAADVYEVLAVDRMDRLFKKS